MLNNNVKNEKLKTFSRQHNDDHDQKPMISQLRPVPVAELQLGKTYLIQEKRPEYQHMKFKGTFLKNEYAISPHHTTMTQFTGVIGRGNRPQPNLRLQELYWNYYEADANLRAWTNFMMREITGDQSFKANL